MVGKLIILICILSVSGCNTITRHSLEGKVPADSLSYIEVSNASALLEELDIFMMKTGMNISWKGQDITELLKNSLSDIIPDMNLEIFNLEKPLGMALLPPARGYEEVYSGLLFLPLKSPGSYNILKRSVAPEFRDLMRESDGYAIIYSNPLIYSDSDPGRSLRMKPFSHYKDGSVSSMINIREFTESMNLDLYTLFMAFNSLNPRQYNFIPFYEQLIGQADKAWLNASMLAGGVLMKGEIALKRQSTLRKQLKQHKPVEDTTLFADYLPGNSMVHTFTNINQEDMIHTYWWLLSHLFPAHMLAEMRMKEVFQKSFTLYEFLGNRSAMSLDISFNQNNLMNHPEPDTGSNDLFTVLDRVTDFKFVEVQELKDRAGYLDSFYTNISEMNKFYSNFHSMGFFISFGMTENSHRNFEWIEIKPEITITDQQVMAESLQNSLLIPIINKILSKSTLLFHATETKGFTVSKDVGLDVLKQIVRDNAYPGYSMKDKLNETHPELTPDDANLLIHLDLDYLKEYLNKMETYEMKNIVFQEHSGGIWMYMKNKKGRIEIGYYADLIDIMQLKPTEKKMLTASAGTLK